ncbi:hypothetical protein G7B40_027465 [Aetokthonos hydrillicola Thurmond2011]|uniref:Uncharacterized protein n=1 Tax=Aetokthonos hydrillicola Thurmond2011 TaxID=2712845 RepID=A0AAP5IB33_9CYAN|nr:hypothetical protein [Aetokthonos hydrillicola]MBO3463050.1 hypothetical protein [Aetokthonos hydrillicola CCALA 1050]MBW4588903.1 hypothetical protein [Aetokthonos hydrillicola CCALA 1050]MDR9898270.1 hypothetical protein [Aetokthonos hydrillicola Thurmond2011]
MTVRIQAKSDAIALIAAMRRSHSCASYVPNPSSIISGCKAEPDCCSQTEFLSKTVVYEKTLPIARFDLGNYGSKWYNICTISIQRSENYATPRFG